MSYEGASRRETAQERFCGRPPRSGRQEHRPGPGRRLESGRPWPPGQARRIGPSPQPASLLPKAKTDDVSQSQASREPVRSPPLPPMAVAACNPGPGGWGVYHEAPRVGQGNRAIRRGRETTNNRMECLLSSAALETLKRPTHVEVFTTVSTLARASPNGCLNGRPTVASPRQGRLGRSEKRGPLATTR